MREKLKELQDLLIAKAESKNMIAELKSENPLIFKKWDILLAGSDKTDTYDISSLPLISTGVYSWHAQMKDKLSSIISKDEIIWALRGYRWQCSKSDAACARILDDGLLAVSI